MSKTVKAIEQEIRGLSADDQWELIHNLSDNLWTEWDRQIEEDEKRGRLDALVGEARAEIKSGNARPLDEIINDP